ncbi:psbP domain-containing protein 4, chloroplastic [Selaginella moellendorffii]|uniref:psbP domain-containing protein 4, chloroplastic n=1 Tax=Selaginella moellendorffii TaxID=88036 RepID=UPI000D1CA10F|nr:psbP domain-containing protein 4, chloroplastic [Selaginella moellendorffii]|eukprot:XP_002985046.2 psbP domain-containing protein 4, chloroplastic [Selaginella moellendorffii]
MALACGGGRLGCVPALRLRLRVLARALSSGDVQGECGNGFHSTHRRNFLLAGGSLILHQSCVHHQEAIAVSQTLLAGRVPGLSLPDENGIRTYRRPDEKSGGHGVGWSPMIPYSFRVPQNWQEVPVSIADLGGTEIDLRFASSEEGSIAVVVAPVRRFSDTIDDNAKIEEIGPPEKVIDAFGPEVTGKNIEGSVKDMEVKQYDGRTYYQYELEPHVLITATAAGNRLYLMSVNASGLQWRKHARELRSIQDSFRVG